MALRSLGLGGEGWEIRLRLSGPETLGGQQKSQQLHVVAGTLNLDSGDPDRSQGQPVPLSGSQYFHQSVASWTV